MTILNPLDEDPLSPMNVDENCQYQYQYGGVKVTEYKLCVVLFLRVVNSEESYTIDNDTMIVDFITNNNCIVHGIIGFDYIEFQNSLTPLFYYNIF